MMWKIILLTGLLFSIVTADDCVKKERVYKEYKQQFDKLPRNTIASKAYETSSQFIDAGIDYLAHCLNDGRSAQYFQIQQEIRRADKKRTPLRSAVIQEYWKTYNVKPIVDTIYRSY